LERRNSEPGPQKGYQWNAHRFTASNWRSSKKYQPLSLKKTSSKPTFCSRKSSLCFLEKNNKTSLVGGTPTPLKNMKVSWDDYSIPNIWKVIKAYKSHDSNHQPDILLFQLLTIISHID
jgi:hypothetical protein